MAKEQFAALLDIIKIPLQSASISATSCKSCGKSFQGIYQLRKKKLCGECNQAFCMPCLIRCPDRLLRCKNCSILTMRPPIREQLLMLKVKDLQQYLVQHDVSTRGCVEKEDLVNLLLRYASLEANPPSTSSSTGTRSNRFSTTASASATVTPSALYTEAVFTTTNSSLPSRAQPSEANIAGGSDSSSSDTSFEMIRRPGSPDSSSSSSSLTTSAMPTAIENLATASASVTDLLPTNRDIASGSESNHIPEGESGPSSGSHTSIPSGSQSNHEREQDLEHVLQTNSEFSSSQSNTANSSPNLLRGTMSAISNETDLEALTVKQLKDMLVRHRVNYHGCCEKAELVDRAKRLYRDYCASRAELEKLEIDELCKVCMDAPVECVMLECGHMATCTDCGRQLSECPICRQYVVRIVRTFKA